MSFGTTQFPVLCLLLLPLLGVLTSKNIVPKGPRPITSIVRASGIIQKPPSECTDYMEPLLRWYTTVSGSKDKAWILHLNSIAACQECYSDKDGLPNDLEACMECHKPFAVKMNHSSHCRECFKVLKPHPKACNVCFLDVKRKVRRAIAHADATVKSAMANMHLHAKGPLLIPHKKNGQCQLYARLSLASLMIYFLFIK
ncbi:unnamed protein product [Dibothriocephalus latus]|uniref:Uncharacterized protein n=1 Tax=Dibothriocephalus latus TaxID=60516 RepID=A0A3P7LJ38_DIBLA|nr:unnamed protein product [Dibothriocephalus latus]